jgi:leucyl aminopeptidase
MVADPEAARSRAAPWNAVASGVFLTRDLVSEPANVLTTTEFARRLEALREVGVEVEVLEEEELERQGMRLLLAVGQGSASPSKVVIMRWNGGGDEKPFALVGKGVVFDTGGISMKPAAGMEDMTMDMGGAAVVAGVMRTLALRKARANVVGLVGLVENMPSGNATRPGDVVRSMKGDTVEIINTDAEGRLVLADVLWYVQERFEPTGIINLATLTGAIIVADADGRGLRHHAEKPDRRHEERGRPRRRLDHRGSVPQALCEGRHAMVPHRHRRRGAGAAGHHARAQGSDGLGRHGAEPANCRSLRGKRLRRSAR